MPEVFLKATVDSTQQLLAGKSYPKTNFAMWADSVGFQDIWMFGLTVLLFLGVIVQLILNRRTIKEMEKVANLDVGGVEIDFRAERTIQAIQSENKKKFKVNFSVIPSGKSMVRIISTRFDFGIKDFMLMEPDWDIRLKNFDLYSHKLLKHDEQYNISAITESSFSDTEAAKICSPIEPPKITITPLCLYGYVKYGNGIGETWIKPFIFRFEWDASGHAIAAPWSNSVKLRRVYPTHRTRLYEFRRDHPKINRMLTAIGFPLKW